MSISSVRGWLFYNVESVIRFLYTVLTGDNQIWHCSIIVVLLARKRLVGCSKHLGWKSSLIKVIYGTWTIKSKHYSFLFFFLLLEKYAARNIFILIYANRIDPEMLQGACLTTDVFICLSFQFFTNFLEKLPNFSTFLSPRVPSNLVFIP